jgi:hypothetical protein
MPTAQTRAAREACRAGAGAVLTAVSFVGGTRVARSERVATYYGKRLPKIARRPAVSWVTEEFLCAETAARCAHGR